jgi:EmrB/QacA subfamily drug resistance transporter
MDAERIQRLRWATLAVLSVSLIMLNLDNTILNVALPTLVRDLHSTTSQLQWIADSYTLVFAGLLLTGGSLGDRLGRKWIFMAGLFVFGLGSVLSAFSGSSDTLIVTRGFMGIGGAMAMPATLSIITNVFTVPKERAKAIAIWSGASGLGIALGPITGGWLLSHFWWGSVFLVNAPIVAAGILAAIWIVPNSKDVNIPKPDPVGSLLSIVALGTILWSIIEAPSKGWSSAPIVTGFVVGGFLLAVFLVWESKISHPMLRLHFFENPRFSMAASSIAIAFFVLGGASFLLTQYLQFVRGYSPLKAGALFLPLAGALLVLSPLSANVAHKFGTKVTVAFGLSVIGISAFMISLFTTSTSLLSVELTMGLVGVGLAFTMPPSAESVMGSLPRAQAGVGSATNGTLIQVGGALGVAILGSLLATSYSTHLSALRFFSMVPAQLRPVLKSSVGSALIAARSLPSSVGSQIASGGKGAFVSALSSSLLVAVGVAVLGAVLVLLILPARARGESEGQAKAANPSSIRLNDELSVAEREL